MCATSDLAAMGALPYCLFLAIAIPKKRRTIILKNLAIGIKKAKKLAGIEIAGGDLVSYKGPLAITVTVVGKKKNTKIPLLRKGAKEIR